MRRGVLIALVIVALLLIFYFGRALGGAPPTCGVSSGTTPFCDLGKGACVGCGSDTDCAAGTYCIPDGSCAACRSDPPAGCPAGTVCVGGAHCYQCGNNNDCPSGELCDPGDHTCKQCLGDIDCSGPTPRCAGGTCVQCAISTDCPVASPVCQAGVCVVCGSDGDCPGGYCTGSGADSQCVPCVAGDGTRPCQDGSFCVATGGADQCEQCRDDGDCAAGQACFGGQCWRGCSSSADCGAEEPNCINGVCVKCGSDSDCAGNAPFDRCVNGLCVQCAASGYNPDDCPANTPYCYSNTCEECAPTDGDSDCTAPGRPYCRLVNPGSASPSYQCVQCDGGTGCDPRGATPFCGAAHTCVACLADTDCPTGDCSQGACVTCDRTHPCPAGQWCSDSTGGQCIACRTDADCAASPDGHVCADGFCRVCGGPQDCGGATPYCRSDGGACVACATDSNCSSPTGYCGTSANGAAWGSCVGCTGDADCTSTAAPYCDSGLNACVGCVADSDCSTGRCDPLTKTCVACTVDADCPAGQVCGQGVCGESCYSWVPFSPQSGPQPAAVGYGVHAPSPFYSPASNYDGATSPVVTAGGGGPYAGYMICGEVGANTAVCTGYWNLQGSSPTKYYMDGAYDTLHLQDGYSPMYYLQADPACGTTLATTTDPTRALTFSGSPICASSENASWELPATRAFESYNYDLRRCHNMFADGAVGLISQKVKPT